MSDAKFEKVTFFFDHPKYGEVEVTCKAPTRKYSPSQEWSAETGGGYIWEMTGPATISLTSAKKVLRIATRQWSKK